MGRGNFWGITELNLERRNKCNVTYRKVMSNFYIEIERCLRHGVAFDLFWNLENLKLPDYREIVTIREDGQVNVLKSGYNNLYDSARIPQRPEGTAPELLIENVEIGKTSPYVITAQAKVISGSAPIFYTPGADKNGVYNNQYVLWELFGPSEEDYSNLWTESWDVTVSEKLNFVEVEIKFTLNKPGNYRLRASTSDVVGRSSIVWKNINVPTFKNP